MANILPYHLAKIALGWIVGLSCGFPQIVGANSELIGFNQLGDGSYQVQFKQAPIAMALEALANKMDVTLHYQALPESDQLMTADCQGRTLPPLLDCLFNRRVDIIARYQQNRLAELWLVSPEISEKPVFAHGGGEKGHAAATARQQPATEDAAQIDRDTERLLAMVDDPDPQQRADGLILLATSAGLDGDKVEEILTGALNDEAHQVRAQAVQGLVQRNAKAAGEALAAALWDKDDDVRMIALDNVGDNKDLLRQVIASDDSFVGNYAARKLAGLSRP